MGETLENVCRNWVIYSYDGETELIVSRNWANFLEKVSKKNNKLFRKKYVRNLFKETSKKNCKKKKTFLKTKEHFLRNLKKIIWRKWGQCWKKFTSNNCLTKRNLEKSLEILRKQLILYRATCWNFIKQNLVQYL